MSITMSDISTSTTGDATSPSCSPVVCPEWCTSTTSHAEEDYVEDQWHRGESSEVTLSRHDLVDYGGTFQMEYLSVQASSEDGPNSPLCVRLSIGDDSEIKLTYGETLALRDALSRRAEEIDPDRERAQKSRGEELKVAREMLNVTPENFAAEMRRTPATMREYEAGVGMDKVTASVLTRALAAAALKAAKA